MHALVYRKWGNRVKGRDWYDFEWYVRNGIPLNFEHFRQRAIDFNGEDLTKEVFLSMLTERLASADMKMVKNDVLPFIKNPSELDIWSNEYFVQLVGMMSIQNESSQN